jgi:hypothetical protein
MAAGEGFALAAARVHGGYNAPPARCQEPPFQILLRENAKKNGPSEWMGRSFWLSTHILIEKCTQEKDSGAF